ncbi:MAG: hypothetical protein K6G37_03090 [Bacilli bacterium]|nr:hypothetical protein [Bacilli bacterium]
MKKRTKKILSIFVITMMALFNVLSIVRAEGTKYTLQFDGASITGDVVTFTVGDKVVTASLSGSGYSVKDNYKVEFDSTEKDTIKLTFDENFDRDTMEIRTHNNQNVTITGDNEAIFGDLDYSEDDAPHVGIYTRNNNSGTGGDNTQNFQGNGTSTLNYKINGVIEYTSGGGYDHGITFSINDVRYAADESKMVYTEEPAYERDVYGQIILNENNEPIPVLDPSTMKQMEEKTALTITGDTIHYNYDENTNKVSFRFAMAPGTLMSSLKINNQPIDLPKTADELLACYTDHRIEIVVNDIDYADTYNIDIEARYPNENEEFLGNFLWDYNPEGYTSPEDKILNGTLIFVEAKYNGVTYTTEEEINNLGGVYIWRDAPRKKTYTTDREGVGEAQFPVGTELTVRIIPDAGYQLVDFGINGGVFEPQDEIGTYKFTVAGGPFHLQATIKQVDDVVKTTSEKISAGAITLGGAEDSMAIGTARLDVKDVVLTKEQITNFEEAAKGLNINSYIDISLFNTVFKGKETQSWDTEVKDLDNEATIALQLEPGVNAEDVVIVHEKHDGTYEIIPTEYIKEYNAIVFKTKSFSNYAIATKDNVVINDTTTTTNTNTDKNPKTLDNTNIYIALLGVSTLGFTLSKLYLKKIKNN